MESYHKNIIEMFRNRNKTDFESVPISRFYDEDIVNQFYTLLKVMKDYPISKECSFIFNFNNDIPNKKLLFDYTIENTYDLNEKVHKQLEDILSKVKSDQNLIEIF